MSLQVDDKEREQSDHGKVLVLKNQPHEDAMMPPWLFRHDDLIKVLATAPPLEKKKLANILNYIHFQSGAIHILMKHPRHEEGVLLKASLEPCMGEELTCRLDGDYVDYNLRSYLFQYLIVTHGQLLIVVPAELLLSRGEEMTFRLPIQNHVVSKRQVARFICHDVNAELWQHGFQAMGELIDFSPYAFRIRVQATPPSSFYWFNSEAPSSIRLSSGPDVLFSGSCKCLQQKHTGRSREIVLATTHDQINRFPAKVLRNPRRQPSPPFHALFEHPFSRKKIQRPIFDISTSGFSIEDKSDEVVLMPGMIIPAMNIVCAGILKIQCKVQVIYRKEEDGKVRFGIAILDMDLANYNKLTQLLNNSPDSDAIMAMEIDIDELWELFFDTGFIYPQKYKHLHAFREDFRETYRKLYEGAPDIAKHFSYQKNGRIYSHVAILRAYERAWMIHHHAARPMDGNSTGFIVLKQLIYYLNDVHRLPSANMDYVFCYIRPENKHDERLFTGFTKEHDNGRVTSLDLFSYSSYGNNGNSAQLPEGWILQKCIASDLWEFEQFYKHHSGGLFWDVMGLNIKNQEKSLERVYAQIGFARKWQTHALRYLDDLKAVIIAEESDMAINLSDLLNGFKVLVMDPNIHPEIINAAVSQMTKNCPVESFPLLIYPSDYAINNGFKFDKQYYLWILDMQHGNEYLKYLGRMFRMRFV